MVSSFVLERYLMQKLHAVTRPFFYFSHLGSKPNLLCYFHWWHLPSTIHSYCALSNGVLLWLGNQETDTFNILLSNVSSWLGHLKL